LKLTKEQLDAEINGIEQEIAQLTQKLFNAQGSLSLAQHIKKTFELESEPKKEPEIIEAEKVDASSNPA